MNHENSFIDTNRPVVTQFTPQGLVVENEPIDDLLNEFEEFKKGLSGSHQPAPLNVQKQNEKIEALSRSDLISYMEAEIKIIQETQNKIQYYLKEIENFTS